MCLADCQSHIHMSGTVIRQKPTNLQRASCLKNQTTKIVCCVIKSHLLRVLCKAPLPSNIISVSDQARLKTNPPTEANLGLPQDIAYLFPANYSYLVVEHSKKEQDAFLGAESHNFTLTVWTNADTPQAAVQWIEDFEKISKTTYRVTRGVKPSGQRVLFKTVRHCHHQQKKLTKTQEKMKSQIPPSRMYVQEHQNEENKVSKYLESASLF